MTVSKTARYRSQHTRSDFDDAEESHRLTLGQYVGFSSSLAGIESGRAALLPDGQAQLAAPSLRTLGRLKMTTPLLWAGQRWTIQSAPVWVCREVVGQRRSLPLE